jgi:hypothetical protein
VRYSAEHLAPLTGLCSLQDRYTEGLEVVGQLTGLDLKDPHEDGRLLQELTGLKQLTYVLYQSEARHFPLKCTKCTAVSAV